MTDVQPDDDSVIQAFLLWWKQARTQRSGIRGLDNATSCPFIPYSSLEAYLNVPSRAKALVNALFPELEYTPDAEYIRKHYLRPFAILLCVGHGSMIRHFINHDCLQDRHLPFSQSPPPGFPFSSKDDIFASFYERQWEFCATEFKYTMSKTLGTHEILPIVAKEHLGRGGSGITYKIVIDEEYNDLMPHKSKTLEPDRQPRNTFVLKTYRGHEAQKYHEAERNAFLRLRLSERITPSIIGFYGSFIRDGTYNNILEYADQGTLEDFMERTPSPSNGEDITLLWERLFNVLHGLLTIQNTPGIAGGFQFLLGWHQDVKPSNIFVLSGSGTSPYDFHFKLADLGLSHFKKSVSFLEDVTDTDTSGTYTYGAPEAHRVRDPKNFFRLEVKQSVDIWSMGCVFSEVATWVCHGWKRVLEYRKRRQAELKELDFECGDFFHNGHSVLNAVSDIHKSIKPSLRRDDNVTAKVLERLVDDMLLYESRPNAKFFYEKSEKIIQEAKSHLKVRHTRLDSQQDQDNFGPDYAETRPMTPPNLPPGHTRYESSSSRKQSESPVSRRSPRANKSPSRAYEAQNVPSLSRPAVPLTGYQRNPPGQHITPRSLSLRDNAELEILKEPHSPSNNYSYGVPGEMAFYEPAYGYLPKPTLQEHNRRHPRQLHANGEHTQIRNDITEHWQAPWTIRTQGPPLPQPDSINAAFSSNNIAQSSEFPTQRNLVYPPPTFTSNSHRVGSSSYIEELPPQHGGKRQEMPPHYELSIERGLRWKSSKQRRLNAILPHEHLLRDLDGRDHTFLIDNTVSMATHVAEIKRLTVLLAYMVKNSNPDGVDMYFTKSTLKIKSEKKTKNLSRAFTNVIFEGSSNMEWKLGQILDEYKSKLGTQSRAKWFLLHKPQLQAVRPLSIYVLTDGVWQPKCDVRVTIANFVESLQQHKLLNKQVGIQFIRFGNNQEGGERLAELDSKLNLSLDIVDTTDCRGNVWKMLHGPINPWFDNDDENNDRTIVETSTRSTAVAQPSNTGPTVENGYK